MELQERVFEVLQQTGLNWTVNKDQLCTIKDGTKTKSYGLIRNDNSQWLGTVGNMYEPYQNHQLAETILTAADGVSDDIRGGYLKGGKKVYLQVHLDDAHVADDTIRRNVTAMNSHDGTTSIGFGSSNTTVICENTYYMAYKEVEKFWHVQSATELIDIAAKRLNQAIKLDVQMIDNFKRMSETSIEKPLFEGVMKRLFDVDLSAKASDIPTMRANQIKKFNGVLESELQSHGETAWGLFSAVTFYTNHVLPGKKKDSTEYVMLGAGYDKNLMTYDEIMNYINSKSGATVLV